MQSRGHHEVYGQIWTPKGKNSRRLGAQHNVILTHCGRQAICRCIYGDRICITRLGIHGIIMWKPWPTGTTKTAVMGGFIAIKFVPYHLLLIQSNGTYFILIIIASDLRSTTRWKSAKTTLSWNGYASSFCKKVLTWQESWCPELDIHIVPLVIWMQLNSMVLIFSLTWSIERHLVRARMIPNLSILLAEIKCLEWSAEAWNGSTYWLMMKISERILKATK